MPQESNHNRHILLLTFPAQGHINPSMQFAKRLVKLGVEVTFVTTVFAHRRMPISIGATKGLNFVSFSDGYDDGYKITDDPKLYMSEIKRRGTEILKEIIRSSAEQGRPISCLVYTLLLAWADGVAREMHVPVALLWIQAAAVLDIYYYYFNGCHETLSNCSNDPSWSVKLPGLPLLHAKDLPSFILPTNHDAYSVAFVAFKEQIEALNAETNTKVLVNSFDALEVDALKAIDKLKLIAVGPVIPSAFLDGKDPSDTSVGADLFQKTRNYSDWLNSKAKGTVVYVSFGSLLEWPKPQMEEIARGLIKSNRPFMWVIRKKDDEKEEKEKELSCVEQLEQLGMIVPWCSQLEVLSHKAVGCFLTHCGWNSTLESLASGVPVVTFPKWTDQGTNAKLIEDVWKVGVRVKANEEGFVDGDEITRCLEMVMEGEEYTKNAKKWRDLAREATKEGGSSDKNLKAFVEDIGEEVYV